MNSIFWVEFKTTADTVIGSWKPISFSKEKWEIVPKSKGDFDYAQGWFDSITFYYPEGEYRLVKKKEEDNLVVIQTYAPPEIKISTKAKEAIKKQDQVRSQMARNLEKK